jgi:hypothetical protein
MKRLLHLGLLACLLLAASCGGKKTPDEAITSIDKAISAGDVDQAQRLADKFCADNAPLDSLPAEQLCRLAMVYAELSQTSSSDNEENLAQAMLCFSAAMQRNREAAADYLRGVAPEKYVYSMMLSEMFRQQYFTLADSTDSEIDSLAAYNQPLPDFAAAEEPADEDEQ